MKIKVKQIHQYQHKDQPTPTSNNSLLIKYNTNAYGVESPGMAWHRHNYVTGIHPLLII